MTSFSFLFGVASASARLCLHVLLSDAYACCALKRLALACGAGATRRCRWPVRGRVCECERMSSFITLEISDAFISELVGGGWCFACKKLIDQPSLRLSRGLWS